MVWTPSKRVTSDSSSEPSLWKTPTSGREGGIVQRIQEHRDDGWEYSEYSGRRRKAAEYASSRVLVGRQEYVFRF